MGAKRTLFLVRHGETEGESSIRYHGRTDVPLSKLGRAQMRAVARTLARRSIGRIYSSPLKRAFEGARIIAGVGDIAIIPEFSEIDFGNFEGLTAEEIRERFPHEFDDWRKNSFETGYAYPGGESRAEFNARVERGLGGVTRGWNGRDCADALIVAHRGVIRAITRVLARAEPVIELASIQIIEDRDGWRAARLDLIGHLHGRGLRGESQA